MSDTCPYCPPATPWGMAPQGFEQMRKWHDAGHPKQGNQVTDLATTDRNASTDVANPPKELPPTQQAENKKDPERSDLHSLRLNTDYYNTIIDTLKDHALKLVANAHSEMTEEQWTDYVNELTVEYAKALTELLQAAATQRAIEARIDELERLGGYKGNYGESFLANDIEDRLAELNKEKQNPSAQLRAQLGGGK